MDETIENAQENTQIQNNDETTTNQENFSDDDFAQALKDIHASQDDGKEENKSNEMLKQVQHDVNVQNDVNVQQNTNEENKNVQENLESEEDLLKGDVNLEKYDTFIKAGFTPEEALQKTYGDFKTEYQKTPNTEFIKPTQENIQASNMSEQDYELFKRSYQAPTDKDLLFHLKHNSELQADLGLGGVDIDRLQTLDIFQDAVANGMFRKTIKDSYRNTIGGFIKNFEDYQAVQQQNLTVRNNLVAEFEADFLKDFPELNNDDIKSYSLGKHFIDRFQKKISVLTPDQQTDSELIRKLYHSAKDEYKKMYPALKKKLGFVDPEKIENAQIKNKKLKEMQENGSQPTNLGNEKSSFMLGKDSSDDDFANAFRTFTQKK